MRIELGGGLEELFGRRKLFDVDVPTREGSEHVSVRDLIVHMRDRVVQKKADLFASGDTV